MQAPFEVWLAIDRKGHHCTQRPAQILEASVPQMKNKGRLKIGADADMIVFDPKTVHDRATYLEPNQTSVRMRWVLGIGGHSRLFGADVQLSPQLRMRARNLGEVPIGDRRCQIIFIGRRQAKIPQKTGKISATDLSHRHFKMVGCAG